MPSTLSADLFFLQPKILKRRFQQYCLSKIFGIHIALVGIYDDQKTEMLQMFLTEIDNLLTNRMIANRTSTEVLDPSAENNIDVTQLLFWSCKSLIWSYVVTLGPGPKIIDF